MFIYAGFFEPVFAQFPVQYLSGAQSQALGRTVLSKPLNVLEASLNPASLVTFRGIIGTLSFANTDFGAENISGGIVIPTERSGSFGLSFYALRQNVDVVDIESRRSTHSYNPNTAIASYGRYILDNLAAGITGKLVYFPFGTSKNEIDDVGVGFGVSAQYELPFQHPVLRDLHIGVLVDNLIQPRITVSDGAKDSLPRQYRVLLQKSLRLGNSEMDLISNIVRFDKSELIQAGEDQEYYALFGFQYSYGSVLFLRGGYVQNNVVMGGGVKIGGFMLDYAFGDYRDDFPRSFSFQHFVSVSYILNP